LRRRLYVRLGSGNLSLELESDRFAVSQPIVLREDLSEVRFTLESGNPARHVAHLKLSGLTAGAYTVHHGESQTALRIQQERVCVITLPLAGRDPTSIRITRP
jgi:hypothetical protein